MSTFKGPFLGFTYGDIHSSTFGIVRTSDGSRFNENLLPIQQNRTVNIPGRDETYYFGGDNTQKQFNISFAFDAMTQEQLDKLRIWLGSKEVRDLEFDERKGIIWEAKVTASSIKYIPFDETKKTIYKGEGSIQFTCYNPYGIKTNQLAFFKNDGNVFSNSDIQYYANIQNENGLPINWRFSMVFSTGEQQRATAKIWLKDLNKEDISSFEIVVLSPLKSETTDAAIIVDSKTGLVEGMYLAGIDEQGNKIYKKSGNIYPNAIINGKISNFNQCINGYFCIGNTKNNGSGYSGFELISETKHY